MIAHGVCFPTNCPKQMSNYDKRPHVLTLEDPKKMFIFSFLSGTFPCSIQF